MSSRRFLLVGVIVLTMLLGWGACGASDRCEFATGTADLTVSAAISLKDALQEIGGPLSHENSDVAIHLNPEISRGRRASSIFCSAQNPRRFVESMDLRLQTSKLWNSA